MAQRVIVTAYTPAWPEKFHEEAARITETLGKNMTEMHHIGSTAVEGLCAKPILDILPVVKNLANADTHNPDFKRIGYACLGEFGIKGRRYFRKGGDFRTHQIHIFAADNRRTILRHPASGCAGLSLHPPGSSTCLWKAEKSTCRTISPGY